MRFPPRPVPTPPPPQLPDPPPMPVYGEFTDKLDLFLPEQASGYNVDHFNYNFEILDKFSGRMMFAGKVNAGTGRTTYLSANARLFLKTASDNIELINDGTDAVGSWKRNEGHYYIVAQDGGGKLFGIEFLPDDWLVSTGEGWVKVNNNGGGGGGAEVEIVGSEWIEVVTEGTVKKIVYKETWKPNELPVR
jgi:hypothetical protein